MTTGRHEMKVPLILNGNRSQPYCEIHLVGELDCPTIRFEPSSITFNAIPLQTETKQEVKIVAKGYKKYVFCWFLSITQSSSILLLRYLACYD